MVLKLVGLFISFGKIDFVKTNFAHFIRINCNYFLLKACFLNNYNSDFRIIVMVEVYYWNSLCYFQYCSYLAGFAYYSKINKTTLILPISLEVYPLNISTISSSSFTIDFQNSLAVNIG